MANEIQLNREAALRAGKPSPAGSAVRKPSKARPVRLRPGMTVAEAFQTIVASCLRHFRLNEPLVIDRRDGEALHQARVSLRRLRVALSLFRPAISDHAFKRLRDEVRWAAAELGDARNLDVLLGRDLPLGERVRIEQKRDCAYDGVIAAMESPRLQRLILDLGSWTRRGQWRRGKKAQKPFDRFATRRIDRLWKKLPRPKRLRAMDEQKLHHLRVQVKKLRYSLEFAATLHACVPNRQKKFGRRIRRLQNALGYFHDAAIARSLLALPKSAAEADEARRQVAAARKSLRRLRKVGPYWRAAAA